MNTDASTFEDMNIHQIMERLSMSCIESSGERFSIFRNRSFTLFRNERDFRERSDSAAVSEFISISMTNLLDTSLTVLVFDISPDFRTWEYHLSSLFHSEEIDELASITGLPVPVCCTFHSRAQIYFLTFRFGVFFSDAVEASTVGSLTRHLDTKLVIGFDFAVTFSSLASSCVLFDIALTLLMELKWQMLNKHKKMVPLITCEISLCQCVCELVFGVNVFDMDLGVQVNSVEQPVKSYSVGSGNMSHCRASSFYDNLDHCFVVFKDVQHGFLTRRIRVWGNKINIIQIIIFPGIFFRVGDVDRFPCTCLFWFVFPWRTVQSDLTSPARVYRPSWNLHPRKWLRNWSLFLTHPADWNERVASKMHNVPPEVDLESSRSPAKSESWNSPNLHCFAVCPTWQDCFLFTCMMNARNQWIQAFVTSFGPFCDRSCKFVHWP